MSAGRKQKAVELIFEEWRKRQKRPNICRLTKERKRLIANRLDLGYEADDFVVLVGYAYESRTAEARWWQGENPNHTRYLDLANLLRVEKLAGRVERAWDWKLTREETGAEAISDGEEDFGLRLVHDRTGGNQ